MPHDPIRAADTRGWLAKADMDLKAAAYELTAYHRSLRMRSFMRSRQRRRP